jgi:protein-disulfide isomerase
MAFLCTKVTAATVAFLASAIALSGQSSTPCPPAACSLDLLVNPSVVGSEMTQRVQLGNHSRILGNASRPSEFPGFEIVETTIVGDLAPRRFNMFASSDGNYMVPGRLFVARTDKEILEGARDLFRGESVELRVIGRGAETPLPGLQVVTVAPSDGELRHNILTASAQQTLIRGPLLAMGHAMDPVIHSFLLKKPAEAEGPEIAPVTMVIYADLQCPACAELNRFLKEDVLKKYPNEVRFIYKAFPLAHLHEWALQAAIAVHCVYRQDPEVALRLQDAIFAKQTFLSSRPSAALTEMVRTLAIPGQEALQCMADKQTLEDIQAEVLEGEAVGVSTTPTIFVNGYAYIGQPDKDTLYRQLDAIVQRTAPRK